MLLLMGFLLWHYSEGLHKLVTETIWRWRLLVHFFSPQILLMSLFSPWKRMWVEDSRPGFNIQRFFEQLSFNTISRVVGLVVRSLLLLVFLLAMLLALLLGLLFWCLWIILPPLGVLPYFFDRQRAENVFALWLKEAAKLSRQPLAHFISSQAGQFWLRHLNLKAETLLKAAAPNSVPLPSNLVSWEGVVSFFVEQNYWTDDYLRTLGLVKEDLLLAAKWWDEYQKKPTLRAYPRPGIGLGLLYGYTNLLDQFSLDLSVPQSFSSHLIGREVVVEKIEKATASGMNIVLTGRPGVGKKTIVLEFARRAYLGLLGKEMSYRRILELDTNALLATATDISEKKTKLNYALGEAAAAGNVILVMRDLHRVTHSELEGYDFTDVFEKALEKRNIKIIAIAEDADYERYLRPNLRLMRFFEEVKAVAPNNDEALKILLEYINQIEGQQPVVVTLQAARRIIEVADQYLTDTPFPEKATELLDLILQHKLGADIKGVVVITPEAVNEVMSVKTGISFIRLSENEKQLLANLEEVIHQKLVNQDAAVDLIAKSLRARSAGIKNDSRPIGSFLFLGPTGVGKTETAKVLARVYYGEEKNILRFDMATFSSPDALERFVGSIQSGRPGDFTTAVKNHPASLVLLDEIEKCSRDIHNLLLSVLDEGRVADLQGRLINCKHLFIIGTSNAAAEFIRQQVNGGLKGQALRDVVVEYCLKNNLFTPELINRFDAVIVYEPLEVVHLQKIAEGMLKGLVEKLKMQNIVLTYTPEVVNKIAQDGFEPAFGARPMRRLVDLHLGDLIGRQILTGKIKPGDSVRLQPLSEKNQFRVDKV